MKSLTMWLAVMCFSFILTGCKNEAEEPAPEPAPAQNDAPPENEADSPAETTEETPGEDEGPALPAPNEAGSEEEAGSLN